MNCFNCGKEIETEEDINFLEDKMLCNKCWEHKMEESREI